MNEITNFAIKASIIVGTVTLSIIILAYYFSPQRNCLEQQKSRNIEKACGDLVGVFDSWYEGCVRDTNRYNDIKYMRREECKEKHSW